MTELTIEEKIAEIKNTDSYQDVKNSWFPPYHEKEYYFVSYSHKDYKLVYESLHRLQSGEKRLNLWYDHNLTPGRDWEIEARRYIYDFNCKGVIFFLSENAVLSQSIHKEIEFVKNSGKSYLSINLPCDKIEGHIGEYLSAAKMLELLKQQGYGIENYEEKSAVLTETFNDKVTFLPLNEDIDSQITKILSLKRQPLLNIDDGTVISINDINALEIKREDFEYLEKNGRKTATKIESCAFANCRLLKKIVLPGSIYRIGDFAFYDCTSLESINIPNRVTSIGGKAFNGCTSLESITVEINNSSYSSQGGILYDKIKTKFIHIPQAIKGTVTIPNGVTSIDDWAFYDCTSLERIEIPISVTSIGDRTFEGCTSLESITVAEGNTQYLSQDGILYNKNKTELIRVPQAKATITVPNGVTTIGDRAFYECTSLESITIPNSVTSIGDWAFSGCTNLTSITIPNSVTYLDYAFYYCTSLKSITVEKDNTEYSSQDGILYNKNKTELLKVPQAITKVTIPDSVTSIGEEAFWNCKNLTSLTIPDSVTSIDDWTFEDCTSLKSVTVEEGNTEYSSQDGILYNKNKTELIKVPQTKSNITIPDTVTSIGMYAFYGCKNFTSITIPDSVNSIVGGAFWDCASLTSVIIPNSVNSIEDLVFFNCKSLKDIFYKGTKLQWNSINKGDDWDVDTPDYTVHCTDGDLKKGEFKI